jgi:hypothetical protein
MIHQDLSQIEGCPERGVKVTVYGLNPWNSMLTFGVDAGSVPNKTDLRSFCDIITERLRRLYDVRDPHVEQTLGDIYPSRVRATKPDRVRLPNFDKPETP